MAATKDISSFVIKFMELSHSGREAKLSLSCQGGQINIQLSLETGYQHPSAPLQKPPRRPGPSRLHRRARRAEDRARSAAAVVAASSSALAAVQVAKETPKQVEVAVQVDDNPPATIEAAVQAGTFPIQKDVAVQVSSTQVHTNAVEAVPQQAAAVHTAQLPHAVPDLFCLDRDYFELIRKKQETEANEKLEKRKKERQEDLENFMKMI